MGEGEGAADGTGVAPGASVNVNSSGIMRSKRLAGRDARSRGIGQALRPAEWLVAVAAVLAFAGAVGLALAPLPTLDPLAGETPTGQLVEKIEPQALARIDFSAGGSGAISIGPWAVSGTGGVAAFGAAGMTIGCVAAAVAGAA